MATCRKIVTAALRKTGVVGEGQQAPPAYDAQVALETLQNWYLGAVAQGLFGRLCDVIIDADYEAGEFERISNPTGATATVTLPSTVVDDCTGETRVPVDLCPVVQTSAEATEPQISLYDGQLGHWVSLNGLTLDSEAPLSTRGPDGLSSLLATALAEEYGRQASPINMARAARFLATLSQRNVSQRRAVAYEYY
jgi:hypothetical protein